MYKKFWLAFGAALCLALAIAVTAPARADAEIGKPAPDFEGINVLTGKNIKLSDLKGKTVVLEWTNNKCPFVRKHYDSGNMQKTQKTARDEFGAKWISIVSSAEGKEGFVNADEAKKIVEDEHAFPDAKLLDPAGTIGKLYGAQTTPHMFIINAEGNLVYKGAIDSDNSPSPEGIKDATNYILAALSDLKAGKSLEHASTQPYGCGVKY